MKKIILTLTMTVNFLGCQKKMKIESISWVPGKSTELLKKVEAQDWKENQKTTEVGKYKIQFAEQSFMGIPIEGTYLKKVSLSSKTADVPVYVEARLTDLPDLKQLSGLTFDQQKIISRLKDKEKRFQKISIIDEKTVFKAVEGQLVPVLKFSFFDKYGEPWTAFSNSKNQILEIAREGSHFSNSVNADTFIFPYGPKLSELSLVTLESLNIEPTLSNEFVIVTSEADQKIMSLTAPLKFDPKDSRFDQVQAFFYLNRSLNWLKKHFELEVNPKLEVVVHVGFPERTNSAFYFQNRIRLGSGDDVTYTNISQDSSIVTHESIHYFIERVAGLPYQGEGGSLNEAFSDFYTSVMLSNPRLGESSYLKAPFKRTLENSKKLSDRNGGLYNDSLIVSGLLWEIQKTVGQENALKLSFAILRTLHKYSDFSDFESKMNELLGSGSLDYLSKEQLEQIKAIIIERGFHVG